MIARLLLPLSLCLVLLASPAEAMAAAANGAQVPEGSSVTLFALGLAGVLLGRHLARRKQGPTDKS